MTENNLAQAYEWLKWEVDRQRNSVVPIKGKTGRQLIAAVFAAVRDQGSPDRDVLVVEDAFREDLESKGADGLAVMRDCRDRGWIETVADDGNCWKLRINETRLVEDAEEFANGADGGANDSTDETLKLVEDKTQPPGFLGLIVDIEARTVRRSEYEAVVELPTMMFRLFRVLYEAGKSVPNNAAVKNAYNGEDDSIRSQLHTLREKLKSLGVTISKRAWRLEERQSNVNKN